MNRRKLTKESLDELAKRMPLLSEEVQAALIGGGDGSRETPFSYWEYKDLGELFKTGWVDLPDSISYLTHPYDYYFGGSGSDAGSGSWGDSGFWEGLSGNWEDSGNIGSGISEPNDDDCKPSCVFYCFDDLDGNRHDWCFYYEEYKKRGGKVGERGAIPPEDLATIAGYGGFSIELALGGRIINKENGTIEGHQAIMTFRKGGIDHAVIIEGWKRDENGIQKILYRDPSKGGEKGELDSHGYTGIYIVRQNY